MSDLKIYVVTLKSYDDLNDFYDDMETPGGNLYIPNRSVDVANRREISRSTHYYLTDEEAQLLRNDPRVLAVELQTDYAGITPQPCYTQTSELWDKSTSVSVDPTLGVRTNWGLLRSYNKQQISNWGSNGTASINGTIQINQSGYNVDVVIVDGHFNPALSELQTNSDGTGGSRVIQYNWLDPYSGTYVYTPYNDPSNSTLTNNNNHGAHVAGIAAGNSQGWARNSNIYNISPYGNQITAETVFDYIRLWHQSKPTNPQTGRKNPTIINNSWVFATSPILYTDISLVNYKGTVYYGPFTTGQLNAFGLFPNGSGYLSLPARIVNVDASIQDCIDDGIIVVGAAGNSSMLIDVSGGENFNNILQQTVLGSQPIEYNRGASPTASSFAIMVGAINATTVEQKATYSNCGPRVDVFSPGTNIMSCVNVNSGYSAGAVADPRGTGYLDKKNGTSMASPQVTGLLACLLQVYPSMNQEKALEYLNATITTNQIDDPLPNSPDNFSSLQNSPNVYLAYDNEQNITGDTYPQNSYWLRPASGSVWPRTNYRKTP